MFGCFARKQAQALIDLALRMRDRVAEDDAIESIVIHTSHHTHYVIGSGSNDPQKYDPRATRETLDHSVMYIFAVALQDGSWHHVDSYLPERATRPDTVRLWRKISTVEDPAWSRRYLDPDASKKAFGGRVEIRFSDGTTLVDELAVADAHPNGGAPFTRPDYVLKFRTLTDGIVADAEAARFLDLVDRVATLTPAEVRGLNVAIPADRLLSRTRDTRGIF